VQVTPVVETTPIRLSDKDVAETQYAAARVYWPGQRDVPLSASGWGW